MDFVKKPEWNISAQVTNPPKPIKQNKTTKRNSIYRNLAIKQNSLNPKWQKEKATWEPVLQKQGITGILKEPKIHYYNYYLVEEVHKTSCLTVHLQFKRENETQMNKCQNTILLS